MCGSLGSNGPQLAAAAGRLLACWKGKRIKLSPHSLREMFGPSSSRSLSKHANTSDAPRCRAQRASHQNRKLHQERATIQAEQAAIQLSRGEAERPIRFFAWWQATMRAAFSLALRLDRPVCIQIDECCLRIASDRRCRSNTAERDRCGARFRTKRARLTPPSSVIVERLSMRSRNVSAERDQNSIECFMELCGTSEERPSLGLTPEAVAQAETRWQTVAPLAGTSGISARRVARLRVKTTPKNLPTRLLDFVNVCRRPPSSLPGNTGICDGHGRGDV